MRHRARTRASFWGLLAVGLVMIVLSNAEQRATISQLPLRLVGGLQDGVSSIARWFGSTIRSVQELRRVQDEYQKLLETVEEYARLTNTVEDLRVENSLLRDQLGLAERIQYDWVSARVIGKEPGSIDGGITINRGRRHGVVEAMPVIAYVDGQEGLVGRISRTAGGYSVVQPVYAPNSYVAARLQRTRHEGLVSGTGRAAAPLKMSYVPPAARNEVAYGDVVVTSGNNSIFPPGLRIGTVRQVEAPPYEPSLDLSLEPAIEFTKLEYVFVLRTAPELRELSEEPR